MAESIFVTRALALAPALQTLSPRERLLIGGLGAIALILVPLKTYDWQQTGVTSAQEALVDLDSARQAARNGAALSINREIAQQKKIIRNWAWSAPSRPIGRVLLENKISTLAIKAGMQNLDVKSVDTIERVGGLDFVQIDMDAVFDWITLMKFFDALSASEKGVIVDSIAKPDDGTPKVHIVLRLPLALPSETSK